MEGKESPPLIFKVVVFTSIFDKSVENLQNCQVHNSMKELKSALLHSIMWSECKHTYLLSTFLFFHLYEHAFYFILDFKKILSNTIIFGLPLIETHLFSSIYLFCLSLLLSEIFMKEYSFLFVSSSSGAWENMSFVIIFVHPKACPLSSDKV